ncbi:MAG: amidase [Rhodobacteraceae bacterium]|nr:amidase [Paracoccaceae bacterium]MCY4196304.1 amidase [Paracoccaceae bacterium]
MNTDERHILLDVNGLCSGYDKVPILHEIAFSILENEVVGILGHNGMGKSTLLKTLMGFLPASSGAIRFRSNDILRLAPHERASLGIGYLPQGRGIFPYLSVRNNLLFAWHHYSGGTENEVMDSILKDFPRLIPLLEREGETLSGGEQQLLALARCLMGDPEFLLLDEPTEGIQPSIIEELVETLLYIRKKRGLTILLVEQNFDFIADLSDRVLVLERGRITGELARSELGDQSKVDAFLGFGAARSTRSHRTTTQTMSTKPKIRDLSPTNKTRPIPTYPAPAHHAMSAPCSGNNNSTVTSMTIKRPTLAQMRKMAARFGMSLSDEELMEYQEIIAPTMEAYDRLDAMPDNLPEVRYPRSPGRFPDPSENELNAWYVKTNIVGAPDGALRGKRIALKDTICLAGVPMMNGSSIMEGYTPEIDATIVTRMLDAGAIISGKAHCENFCLSGGSHTNAKGPVHNPWKRGYMAGGSSSGSAALVAAGEVDMAIAGDQGGSIRLPASCCGTYGMKASHGVVPYTGVMPIEMTIDHLGPITKTVADNALLLEVLAGEDGLDPRQYKPKTYRYTEALGRGVQGMRIGVLKEGFVHANSEDDVSQKVLIAAERFRELGALVDEISIPEHYVASDAWSAITNEGLMNGMMWGNSAPNNCRGLFLPSMIDHMAQWQNRADELSHSLKACMFIGEYFQTQYRGRFYGKAQNIMRKCNARYVEAFKNVDLLLMPTMPHKPQEIPPADCSISLYVARAFQMIANTAPFNGGLPAMTVPCGLLEGLPIGMQLVGNSYKEMTIYQAAHAFEQSGDWRAM